MDILQTIVSHLQPQPHWHVIDINTTLSSLAAYIAPQVAQLTAVTGVALSRRTPTTAHLLIGDRIAHRWPIDDHFLDQINPLLAPDSLLVLIDPIIPGSNLRGKKADKQRQSGRYLNALYKLHNPANGRCHSLSQWQNKLRQANLTIQYQHIIHQETEFTQWVAGSSIQNQIRLRAMLIQAPPIVNQFLTPQIAGDRITFYIQTAIIIAQMR